MRAEADSLELPRATEVHIWQVSLEAADAHLGDCLSAPELERMNRLLGSRRDHFAITHGAARHLLGAYLGLLPELVPLTASYGEAPQLPGLKLSISHCEDLAVLAVARVDVGVDVEPSDEGEDDHLAELAYATLSDSEMESFRAIRGPDRPRWWIRAWVRKEAVLKALGLGISDRVPHQVDVSRDRVSGLSLSDIDIDSTHIAAVATATPVSVSKIRGWER
ncbi:MAG: 4'-phosphopantetheinyl transferase superfamily protein [Actinobacteria bacterium]|nr:4'-phosphopantetheinyl transferase superfamily protein [Actinomycetota bacterium]